MPKATREIAATPATPSAGSAARAPPIRPIAGAARAPTAVAIQPIRVRPIMVRFAYFCVLLSANPRAFLSPLKLNTSLVALRPSKRLRIVRIAPSVSLRYFQDDLRPLANPLFRFLPVDLPTSLHALR